MAIISLPSLSPRFRSMRQDIQPHVFCLWRGRNGREKKARGEVFNYKPETVNPSDKQPKPWSLTGRSPAWSNSPSVDVAIGPVDVSGVGVSIITVNVGRAGVPFLRGGVGHARSRTEFLEHCIEDTTRLGPRPQCVLYVKQCYGNVGPVSLTKALQHTHTHTSLTP